MGYGSYNAGDWKKLKGSRNISSSSKEEEIFVRHEINPKFDPKFIGTREARDSADHPNSTPIILGLDVTGSMGYLAAEIASNALNETMTKLYSTKVVEDPAIMFAAYGDYLDDLPLQVTQFESDIRIAEQLMDLWLELHGSGMVVPVYLWYFAARHTSLDAYDKHQKKGFLFTIGDDADNRPVNPPSKEYQNWVELDQFEEVFGEKPEADLSDEKIVEEVSKKFELFHIVIQKSYGTADDIPENISALIPGRVIVIKGDEYKMLPEILISIMQVVRGAKKEDVLNAWDTMKRPTVMRILKQLPNPDQGQGIVF